MLVNSPIKSFFEFMKKKRAANQRKRELKKTHTYMYTKQQK